MTRPVIPFQRYEPPDVAALRKQVEEYLALLDQASANDDVSTRLHLLAWVGEAYTFLGNFQEAFLFLGKALALARRLGDQRREVANLIRLATAHQYAGNHAEAEARFYQALDLANLSGQTEYLDHAWQHLGKCLVEQGRVDEAIRCFEQALALRKSKGDASLIASTERALAAVRQDAYGNERK